MKNICVLYYEGFYDSEVAMALQNLSRENIFSAAVELRPYTSAEKQRFLPDRAIKEVKAEDVDLLIIPGGDPSELFEVPEVIKLIKELNISNKYIAGICGGTFLMAWLGVLDGRRCTGAGSGLRPEAEYMELFTKAIVTREGLVTDGNAITSTAQSFIEFCTELGWLMGVYASEEERDTHYKWLKNIRD